MTSCINPPSYSSHDYEGVMSVLCTPLQVKCHPLFQYLQINWLLSKPSSNLVWAERFSETGTHRDSFQQSSHWIGSRPGVMFSFPCAVRPRGVKEHQNKQCVWKGIVFSSSGNQCRERERVCSYQTLSRQLLWQKQLQNLEKTSYFLIVVVWLGFHKHTTAHFRSQGARLHASFCTQCNWESIISACYSKINVCVHNQCVITYSSCETPLSVT